MLALLWWCQLFWQRLLIAWGKMRRTLSSLYWLSCMTFRCTHRVVCLLGRLQEDNERIVLENQYGEKSESISYHLSGAEEALEERQISPGARACAGRVLLALEMQGCSCMPALLRDSRQQPDFQSISEDDTLRIDAAEHSLENSKSEVEGKHIDARARIMCRIELGLVKPLLMACMVSSNVAAYLLQTI